MKKFLAIAFILIAVISWSLSFPLVKILLNNNVPPITMAMLRHLIFIPMLIFITLRDGKTSFSHTKKAWLTFLLLGIFTIFIPNVSQNIGMQYTTASTSSIIQSSTPIFTIILAFIFLKESKNFSKIIGTVIAMIGVILLVSGGKIEMGGTTYGNILILVSCISYAISGVILKRGLMEIKASHLLCFETLFGFVFLFFSTLMFENVYTIATFDVYTWFLIAILAIFASGIAAILYYVVLIDTELSQLIVFVYLIPLFAVVFSYFMLGETVSLQILFFAALIISGVVIAQKNKVEMRGV